MQICMSLIELILSNKDNVVHLSVKASPTKYVTSHEATLKFSPELSTDEMRVMPSLYSSM